MEKLYKGIMEDLNKTIDSNKALIRNKSFILCRGKSLSDKEIQLYDRFEQMKSV